MTYILFDLLIMFVLIMGASKKHELVDAATGVFLVMCGHILLYAITQILN